MKYSLLDIKTHFRQKMEVPDAGRTRALRSRGRATSSEAHARPSALQVQAEAEEEGGEDDAVVVGGFVVGEIGTLLRAAFVKTEHRPELSLVLLPPAHQRSGTNTAKLFLAVPYVAD